MTKNKIIATIQHKSKQYEIWSDGIVYDNSTAQDIPAVIFAVRDLLTPTNERK